MKTIVSILLLALCSTHILIGQHKLKPLSARYKIRGYFYAGSKITDSLAFGGFAESPNAPKSIANLQTVPGQLSIRIVQDDTSRFFTDDGKEWKGMTVLLLNATDSIAAFDAQDSRLNMVCQAFFQERWVDIEYLPASWCGNSYHTVYLGKQEYWQFKAANYTGSKSTKLRFKLVVTKGNVIYSNEIDGAFNPKLLTKIQGHKRQGLMDSYDD